MEELSMSRDDWLQLADFVRTANDARKLIVQVAADGKAQVSLQKSEMVKLKAAEAPPEFWIKIGSLLHEKLKGDESCSR